VRKSYIVAILPDNVLFEDAAVLPLSLGVAAEGLYAHGHLSLPFPDLKVAVKKRNEVVFIAGGASAVGTAAVQLASLSGYSVVATASRSNAELVKSLGARAVIDYRSETADQDIVTAIRSLGYVRSLPYGPSTQT
jgi:NADPH:quinone reductase-like Zn-dependent oxidoreductase